MGTSDLFGLFFASSCESKIMFKKFKNEGIFLSLLTSSPRKKKVNRLLRLKLLIFI